MSTVPTSIPGYLSGDQPSGLSVHNFRHVVFSPHLDDAALSMGGSIHRWASNGEPVLVVTVMAGDPPDGAVSSFAEYQHSMWQLPAREAYAVRRKEDVAAMHVLGAHCVHLNFLDCIYRRDKDGFFYTSEEAIFGTLHSADLPFVLQLADLFQQWARAMPDALFYAPLAIGNHVDHQLVRQALDTFSLSNVRFFQDFPYVQNHRVESQTRMCAVKIWLSDLDLETKKRAISCYESQIKVLFGDREEMESQVQAFGNRLGDGVASAELFFKVH